MMLVDLFLAALALALSNIVHYGDLLTLGAYLGSAGMRLTTFMLLAVFSAFFCEMYRWEKTFGRFDLAARTAVSVMLAFFMLSAYYYLLPVAQINRDVLSSALLMFGTLQFFTHLGVMKLTQTPLLARRVLILGVGPLAQSVEQLIIKKPERHVLVGFVRPKTDPCHVDDSKIIGDVDNLAALIKEQRINRVVVALTERRGGLPVRELLHSQLDGVNIVDAVSFYEEMSNKLLIEDIQPSWFLYSDGFRVTPFLYFFKRVFDIVFAVIGIVLLLPFLPLVALLVRLDSPGPVFFRQIRVGEREQPFIIYKFRTMRQDAEKETGAVWSPENDPRITKLGNLLRKTRVDELPQLYNVLKGNMSLVGPRPERPEFVAQLNEKIPYYSSRHFMKPGATGWAQIWYPYGASDEDALEKLRYDLYYIKNYTLLLDLLIVLETIKVVVFGRGGR
jgi:sugar transferase (PEP-CTERM system associated)